MTQKTTMEIMGKIVELLTPLESDERLRIISATLTLFGEKPVAVGKTTGSEELGDADTEIFSPRARAWMRQYALDTEQIQQVFHLANGTAEVIAATIPGNNTKEKTFSVYILSGIANLLAKGDSSFDDKTARELCKTAGCYDSDNHASYMKSRGNEFTGSKDKGWVLTSPGLKRGAELVKELNK